jgi:arylsulfatase A-like enzyme
MADRPNVIVFMTDDQGYGDLSCMGATDFRTPRLDRLAVDGARFTDWYSNSPVCSPSRAALLTGRYPGNAGVRSILQGHRTATGLPPSTPTLANHLANNGYQTSMTGKWHLGMADESRPHNQGFENWYGFLAGCIDFYSHIFYWGPRNPDTVRNPTHDLWENNEEIWQNGEYFTTAIKDRAVSEVRRMAASDEPFFLYVPFNAPHYPMHAPQEYMDRFAHLPWDRQVMAAMISAVDDGIGEIMDEVERSGQTENTLTFFVSDNGPSRESRNWLDGTMDPYYGGTSGGLKGHKFSLFEGGVRVPGIMHWPGHIPAGQVIDTPSHRPDRAGGRWRSSR